MNRMSLLFAALLAASFAMTPGNAPESSQAPEKSRAGSGPVRKTAETKKKDAVLPEVEAINFIAGFLNKGSAYANTGYAYQVLFATVSDPVQTHLAAAFDHDVAALQDGVQDSGYLFDSSWIPWEIPQSYDTFADEVNAEELRRLKHELPGILLFRDAQPRDNPYARGLIVFLLAEKPTAGINITQAANALQVLASATAAGAAAGARKTSLSWEFTRSTQILFLPRIEYVTNVWLSSKP